MKEFSEKAPWKNKEMVFKNGVENIKAVAYNGACTVIVISVFSFNCLPTQVPNAS